MYRIDVQYVNPEKIAKFFKSNQKSAFLRNNFILTIGLDKQKIVKGLQCSKDRVTEVNSSEYTQIIESLKAKTQEPEKIQTRAKANVELPENKTVTEGKMGDNTQQYKVDFKAPKVRFDSNEALEQSISAIKLAQSMNAIPEAQLIYLVIIETNNLNLLSSLSTKQLNEVDEFIKHLRECYGSSQDSLRRLGFFDNIAQHANESDPIFFNRLFRTYYESRNATIPALEAASDTDQYLIKAKFCQKINNPQVRQKLVETFSTLEFAKLGQRAKEIREAEDYIKSLQPAKQEEKQVSVLALTRGRPQENYEQRNHNRSGSNHRAKSIDRNEQRCYRCNGRGHPWRECRASPNTVRRFRDRMDQQYLGN